MESPAPLIPCLPCTLPARWWLPWPRLVAVVAGMALCMTCFPASRADEQEPAPQRTVRVVMDDNYPPYVFRDEAGRVQGILIDLWRAWERKTGIAVEVHAMDWDEAVRRMQAGEFDVIDTIFQTEERRRYLDFSQPYATLEVPIFFRQEITGITDLASLKGFVVAAKRGDVAVKLLEEGGIAPILQFNNYEAIITAAGRRKVNVFVMDKPPALYFLHKQWLEEEFRMTAPVSIGEFHRAVRKGDAVLLRQIEQGFAQVGVAEFNRIKSNWYGQTLEGHPYLQNLGYAALAAVALITLLVGWNRILAMQVMRRTVSLLEREEQLRLYAEHSPAAIAMLDRDLRYLVVSRRWMEDYRLGEQSIIGRGHYEIFPEVPAHWKEIHQRCLAGAVETCAEELFRRADGSADWLRWEVRPWRQADDTIGGLIMFTEDITARKQAEEVLREGEMRLMKAFRRSPVALAVGRRGDKSLVDINDAFSDLLGWSREAAVGHTAWDLNIIDERGAEKIRAALHAGEGAMRDLELTLTTSTGEVRHVLAGMETIELQGGPHVVSTFVDITARKLAEAALERQQAMLRRVLDTNQSLIFVKDRESRILMANEAAAEFYGLRAADIVGRRQDELHRERGGDPADIQQWLADDLAVLDAGVMAEFAETGTDHAGRLHHFSARKHPFELLPGQPAVLVVSVDVTDLVKAGETLHESEERLRILTDNARVGLVLVSLDRRYLFANATYGELLGLPHADIVGRAVAEVLADGYEEQIRPQLDRALAGERVAYELRRMVTGEECHFAIRYEPIRAEGQVSRVAVAVMDITERKLAEERVRRLNRTYAVLNDINQLIVRERDPQVILDSACRIAVEKGRFRMAWIGMVDGPDGKVRVAARAGEPAGMPGRLDAIVNAPSGGTGCVFTARVLQSGEHAVCNDIANEPAAACWGEYQSLVVLPLRSAGNIIGTFHLHAHVTDFFDADEMRLLDELATDISFALEVSRRETERRAGEIRVIRQRKTLIELTSDRRGEGDGPLVALRKIAEGAAHALKVARVSIWRHFNERSAIRCVDLYEWEEGRHSSGEELFADTHPAYFRALAEQEMIVADDAMVDPSTREFAEDYLRPHDIRSLLDVPIMVSGVRTGVLCLEHVGSARVWTTDEKTFALAVTNLVSLALEGGERRQAEASLRESEKRFRQFAETIEEVFWMTDATGGEMLYVSPAYEKIWQRTCVSLYTDPRSWLEAVHPEDRERVAQAAQAGHTRGEYDETYRILRPDGGRRWIHDRAFPVRDSHGAVVRVVGTARDITDSRQVEEQLLRAQRMESIGTLAGGIAHDLNNVLTPIMMSIELLKQQEQDRRRLNVLTTIEGSARRGADMVRQVLTFARGVEGRRLEVQPGRLLQEIVTIARETFPKNIQVRGDIPADLRTLRGDPTQLHQVLLNLCVNARDAMPAGGSLSLSASNLMIDAQHAVMNAEARPGPYVLIQVEDNGCGMSAAVLDRVFEPFYTTKEQGRGTGLGLSTSLAIIKSHGGFIRPHSTVGQGTRFQVYLPAQTAAAAAAAADGARAEMPRGQGELVLLIDDEEAVRQIIGQTLETCGYRVLMAADGAEAVSLYAARQEEIAVVLTDMMMPLMDGAATIQVLMKMNPQARIIAASGIAANDAAAREAGLGVKHFIPKPYTAETLLKTLHTVLRE